MLEDVDIADGFENATITTTVDTDVDDGKDTDTEHHKTGDDNTHVCLLE